MSKGNGEWSHGLCACFDDGRNCMMGTFCCCCLVGESAKRMDKSYALYCLLTCCIPIIPLAIVRGEARQKYNIDGGGLEDCLCAWCCGSCVNCQIANELDSQGVDK